MRRSASAPISPRVSGVSGACSDTKSERSSSSSSATPPPRLVWSTSQSKPSTRRATAWPMRPKPTMPTVAPWRSWPSSSCGLPGAPLAAADVGVPLRQSPRDAEHQRDRQVGGAVGQDVRGVADRDPARARRLDVDVVDAHRVVRDRPQPRGRLDQLGVDAVGEQRKQTLELGSPREQLLARRRQALGPDLDLVLAARRSRAPPGSLRVTKTFTAEEHATIRRRGAFDLASCRGHGAVRLRPVRFRPGRRQPPRPARRPVPRGLSGQGRRRASRSPAGWRAPPRCAACRRSCP